MKLASLKHGRDGRLVVVSDDLTRAAEAGAVAPTLQAALDNWGVAQAGLRALADALNRSEADGFPFREEDCASPLPRAYQWADGSAYVNHVELVRKARGAELPASFWEDPLMYQGGSDSFLGPHEPIRLADAAWGIDFEAEVAAILTDTPMAISSKAALEHIALLVLVNDVSLRNLIPGELAKGFGFFQGKPSSAFSPVAVTPDALGADWRGGKLTLPVLTAINGMPFGRVEAGEDMTFDFGRLVAHAAKTRPLAAGTLIGSGTISNRDPDGGPGRPIAEGGRGYACIAEQRMVETIRVGRPETGFLDFGDVVRIEMADRDGRSIFGTIEQTVEQYTPPTDT